MFGPGISAWGVAPAVLGAALAGWSILAMGRSLTPLPAPKAEGELVERGPYRFLRHPMYVGAFLFFAGLSVVFSAWGLALTGVLGLFWIAKARLEERFLLARFPEYADYRRRTIF